MSPPGVIDLSSSKPCNGCRRRKIRCDKTRPCLNCQRHGENCVYEPAADSGTVTLESQQRLQDRLDKLERLVHDMSLATSTIRRQSRNTSRQTSPEDVVLGRSRDLSLTSTESEDHGVQLFEPNVSYYMHPGYWVSLREYNNEPHDLLRWPYEDRTRSNASSNFQSIPPSLTQSLAQFHLPIEQQEILHDWFYQNVDPWIRTTHYRAYIHEVSNLRIGKSTMPREMEAAIFSVHAMTISAMPSDQVQRLLGRNREDLLQHFQYALELALNRANYMRSRNIFIFVAALHYLTFLFHTGQAEKASIMLGGVSRIGMRMGLHRDPSLYAFNPWVAEVRRRVWTYFLVLDSPVYNCEGAESVFDTLPWTPRPINANNEQWPAHRFVKPDQVPAEVDGFTDMTFVIVRREQLLLTREIARHVCTAEPQELMAIVAESDSAIRRKYLDHLTERDPMQAVIMGYYRACLKCLRLGCEVPGIQKRPHTMTTDALHNRILSAQLELFEELEETERIATQHHWQWIFRWPPPFHSIARLLFSLAQVPETREADRAWKQVEIIFRRHNNGQFSMVDVPAWRVIERLCDNAMYAHSSRVHDGAVYTIRPARHQAADSAVIDESIPNSSTQGVHESLLADIDMFNQLPDNGFGMAAPWVDSTTMGLASNYPSATTGMQYPSSTHHSFQP